MANYYGVVRTNYFHVKDEEKFRALMAKVICGDGSLEFWDDEKDADGNQLFGFGVYGSICGLPDEEGDYDDDSYDRFVEALMDSVADDDAILIFEAGHEKLRYVGGGVLVITSEGHEFIDLHEEAFKKAQQLIGNDQWETKATY